MTDGAASSSSAKTLLERLEPVRDEVVLAVDGVLKAEIVEDGRHKRAACRVGETVRDLDLHPKSILRHDVVEVQVVDGQQSTLFEVGKHNAPAATEIGQRTEEQIILEGLFILALDRGQFRVCVAVAVVTEGEGQRFEDRLAEGGIVEYAARGRLERVANPGAQAYDLDEVIEMAGLQRGILPVVGEAQEFLVTRGMSAVL